MNNDDLIYSLVERRELEIAADGTIWRSSVLHRVGRRQEDGRFVYATVPCERRRAEIVTHYGYLAIHKQIDGRLYTCGAHRIVWRHFHGPLPPGITPNHKNGVKTDNRPDNLELSTASEQTLHAIHVLKRRLGRWKLTDEQVREIRDVYRGGGVNQWELARRFGVSQPQIGRIVRGESRRTS